MTIHLPTAAHWPQVRAIYEQGIATGNATFQTQAPGWDEWDPVLLERRSAIVGTGTGIPASVSAAFSAAL